jgi:DNA-binding MarR family transcriptional regulator
VTNVPDAGFDNSLALERQLCLDLSAAARAVVSLYRPLLDPLGLTHPQYLVLAALWESKELTVKQLGEVLHLDSGTLSPLLKRLEAAGLVWRTRGAEDERRVLVGLTDAGRELRDQAVEVHAGVVSGIGLERAELEELHDILQRVVKSASRS